MKKKIKVEIEPKFYLRNTEQVSIVGVGILCSDTAKTYLSLSKIIALLKWLLCAYSTSLATLLLEINVEFIFNLLRIARINNVFWPLKLKIRLERQNSAFFIVDGILFKDRYLIKDLRSPYDFKLDN